MTKKCGDCKFREKPRKRVNHWVDVGGPPRMYCSEKKENRIRYIWKNCDLWELNK